MQPDFGNEAKRDPGANNLGARLKERKDNMSEHKTQSIGREAALALVDKKWWEGKTAREIAEFQMLTEESCITFGLFHKAMEETLARPVFTHEFALNFKGLQAELFGERPAPSFQEIIELIPEEKRIVVGY